MGENSKIEWCLHTFNAWEGCEKVSPGCANCYAERRDKQYHGGEHWGASGTRKMMSEVYWKKPVKWNREAECNCGAAGCGGQECDFCAGGCVRPRVFCSSLADVFENRPELLEPRRRLFDLINDTPNLDWLLLTKRPENVELLFDDARRHFNWDEDMSVMNIWLGTSVENQKELWRIDELRKIPATIRFLSIEPLLEDLGKVDLTGIHLVIVGGESGPNARPMHPDWVRSLRDQCQAAGVPFFLKQWGEWEEETFSDEHAAIPDSRTFAFGDGVTMVRTGKKAAGRLLDGKTWNELPR